MIQRCGRRWELPPQSVPRQNLTTETWWKPMNRSIQNSFPQLLKSQPATLPSTRAARPENEPTTIAPGWSLHQGLRHPYGSQNPWRVTFFISNLTHDGGAEVQS